MNTVFIVATKYEMCAYVLELMFMITIHRLFVLTTVFDLALVTAVIEFCITLF